MENKNIFVKNIKYVPMSNTITSSAIADYFKAAGLDVDISISSDPIYNLYKLYIKPKFVYSISLSNNIIEEEKSSDIIKMILDKSLLEMQRYYAGVLGLNNTRSLQTDNIDNYCIVYNPNKVSPDIINKIVITLEL